MPSHHVQYPFTCLSQVPKVIFSDIDGTIVHYEKNLSSQGYRLVREILDGSGDHEGLNRGVAVFNHPSRRRRCLRKSNVEKYDIGNVTGSEDEYEYEDIKCWKVPSLTLGGGFISLRTFELVNQLREEYGVQFVLLTGARTSTMMMRRRSETLPKTAYDVWEGGSKISDRRSLFGVDHSHENNDYIPVNEEWSAQFEILCGSSTQLESDPLKREGPMWDIYRQLHNEGYVLDAKSFSASFMVLVDKCEVVMSGKQTIEEMEADMKRRFSPPDGEFSNKGFIYLTNLSKGQIVPEKSGKHNAANYILKKLFCPVSSDAKEINNKEDDDSTLREAWAASIALFDDENDLEFAGLCGAGFIPSVAHPSVIQAIEKYNNKRRSEKRVENGDTSYKSSVSDCFVRTSVDGLLGTEEALEAILHYCQVVSNNKVESKWRYVV
eukprot:Tbor_TRINITY_DN3305_c0_g1::TRINITY_DN3305_c0_g1_i1::g.23453::m.23453